MNIMNTVHTYGLYCRQDKTQLTCFRLNFANCVGNTSWKNTILPDFEPERNNEILIEKLKVGQ